MAILSTDVSGTLGKEMSAATGSMYSLAYALKLSMARMMPEGVEIVNLKLEGVQAVWFLYLQGIKAGASFCSVSRPLSRPYRSQCTDGLCLATFGTGFPHEVGIGNALGNARPVFTERVLV